jgi:fermentation-respiration switch protein FrsA (DUF1100 family)
MALENALLYFPSKDLMPLPAGRQVEEVWLQSSDGTRIHSWWFEQPGADFSLLYCHGNGGNLSNPQQRIADLQATLHCSVLIFDYPGYGQSESQPSEAGCHASADAAYRWLAGRCPAERIVLFGESLGGGVATELATYQQHAALILVSTFTSIPDMAQRRLPFLPARWLARQQYDNLAKISRLSRPIYITHGDKDWVIPHSHSERLFAAATQTKRFFLMKGADHYDRLPLELREDLLGFLKSALPPSKN